MSTRRTARALGTVALMVLGGCGSATLPPPLQGSPVVLTAPPEVALGGGYGDGHYTHLTGATFEFVHEGMEGHAARALTVPGAAALYARLAVHAGQAYFLVGAIDANEHWTLYRYHDVTGDGAPDASTQTLLIATGAPSYITDLAFTPGGSRCYLLDRRCQDVRLATDTNSDGWIDQLQATPFAMSETWPTLLSGRVLDAVSSAAVRVREFSSTQLADIALFPADVYTDTDADSVADTSDAETPFAVTPFITGPLPYAGQTSLLVGTPAHGTGPAIEIWTLDAAGGDVALLGSGTPTGAGEVGAVSVPLSPSLIEGQSLGVRFVRRTASQLQLQVLPALPQVVSVVPYFIATGTSATTVLLQGANFSASTSVTLIHSDGTTTTLVPTLLGPGTISVSVPGQSEGGGVTFRVRDPGEDPDHDALAGAVLCDPALLAD